MKKLIGLFIIFTCLTANSQVWKKLNGTERDINQAGNLTQPIDTNDYWFHITNLDSVKIIFDNGASEYVYYTSIDSVLTSTPIKPNMLFSNNTNDVIFDKFAYSGNDIYIDFSGHIQGYEWLNKTAMRVWFYSDNGNIKLKEVEQIEVNPYINIDENIDF